MRRYLPTIFIVSLMLMERLDVLFPRILDGFLSILTLPVLFMRAILFNLLHVIGHYPYSTPSALSEKPSWVAWFIGFLIIGIPIFVLNYFLIKRHSHLK